MTTRDRKEQRAERLREWAEKREQKSQALQRQNDPFRGDIALATQPGHIPERVRANNRDRRAWEHSNKADEMRSRADGIETQLDTSIYSDDPDAVESLEARVANLEAQRDQMKARNAEFRKAHRAELKTMTAYQRSQAVPHPGWEVTNLSANIKRNRDRIEEVKRRQMRQEKAEARGGVIIEGDEYVQITFAEKPDRAILDSLKTNGFFWSGGSWHGPRDRIPQGVAA